MLQGGVKLIFEHYQATVECGIKTKYEVSIDYNVENRQEEPDCEMINGTCVFFGHSESAVFKIMEMNADYTQNITSFQNNTKDPGEPIYIAIKAEYVPSDYDWVVTECFNTNLDSNVSVQLINPKEIEYDGICNWDPVNLVSEYAASDEFRMSHSVFLIGNPSQTNIRLTCKIEICEKNDFNSVCKKAGRTCGKFPPICESENVNARIVGGSSNLDDNLPFESMTEWILYLSMGCGASWIDKNTILTAAHCFDFEIDENTGNRLNTVIPNKIYQVSKYNRNSQNDTEFLASFMGSQVVIHPEYDDVKKLHDVAIINL